ncbi:hypothetical protein MMC30_005787 [Trapelia coarctata]|nr:hypothetical protein [Trapelia coarctata]
MLKDSAEYIVLTIGGSGYIYQYRGLAYKLTCFQRELDMLTLAGDCGVKAVARVMEMRQGRLIMTGLLMELETPFDVKSVPEAEKHSIMEEMIALVNRLHNGYRMVHGDIKPLNLLRCRDGKLRLCDFDTARPIDEDPQVWEGLSTWQYLAPNRDFLETGAPPTVKSDLYALGISIWELWTGKEAFSEELDDMEDVLKERRTVDLAEIKDVEARELVKGFLRGGGAPV